MRRSLFLSAAALLLAGCGVAQARPSARVVDPVDVLVVEAEAGDGWLAMATKCGVTLSDFHLLTGIDPGEVLHPRMRVLCPAPAPTTTTTTTEVVTTSTDAPTTTEPVPSSTVTSPPSTVPTTATTSAPASTTVPSSTTPTTVGTLPPTTTSTLPPTTTSTVPTTTTTPPPTTLPPAPGVEFEEHFTDTSLEHFNSVFNVELKDLSLNSGNGAYQGDHDMACGAPTTQRTVHNMSLDQVWLCAPNGPATGHVMTAAGAADYSYTIFTPDRSFTGRSVCWNVNLTTAGGGRTWWEVTFLPADFYATHPTFAYSSPVFPGSEPPNGRPFPAAAITFDFTQNVVTLWEGTTPHLGEPWWSQTDHGEAMAYAVDDKATRYLNCVQDTAAGLKLTQNRPDGEWTYTVPGLDLPEEYVVGFKAENYNAGKEDSVNQTWHWDDIVITA